MKGFRLLRTGDVNAAAKACGEGAAPKAGGIDLLDRMKERTATPGEVLELDALVDPALREIAYEAGVLRIGALVTLSQLAGSDVVRRVAAPLAEAAGQAASLQIRNRATIAGNVLQQSRCGYFRHAGFDCLRRGGDSCPVLAETGVQGTAGVFDNGLCASAHPSSVAPVLGALGASVHVVDVAGTPRTLSFAELWTTPRRGDPSDDVLAKGDLIVGLSAALPASGLRAAYEEIRQKAAFDWPLVSVCVRLPDAGATTGKPSVWFGSLAPVPWRHAAVEQALAGSSFDGAAIARAAETVVHGATPLAGSAHKLALAGVALRRALGRAVRGA